MPGSNLVMRPAEVTARSVDAPCKVMVDRVPPRYHWFTLKVTSSPAAFVRSGGVTTNGLAGGAGGCVG